MATNTMNLPLSQESRKSETTRLVRWLPSLLWILAAVLLLVSIAFPYWGMVLQAPQYPGGLQMRVFVNRMTGDENPQLDEVHEIDELNHYIGMKSLYEAAPVERALSIPGIIASAVLLAVAALWRRRWTWLLALPPLTIPVFFLGVMGLWLRDYGQNLDPYAPLSSAIHPFTPPVLGEGTIGQFKTIASVDTGWYLALAAVVLIVAGLALRYLSSRTKGGANA